jgi:hypothetical protein
MSSPQNFEEKLKLAKSLVLEGCSIRDAARKAQISSSTLQRKIKNKEDSKSNRGKAPLLTSEEESDLVKWILFMENWGCPRTRKNVITQVSKYNFFESTNITFCIFKK